MLKKKNLLLAIMMAIFSFSLIFGGVKLNKMNLSSAFAVADMPSSFENSAKGTGWSFVNDPATNTKTLFLTEVNWTQTLILEENNFTISLQGENNIINSGKLHICGTNLAHQAS